MVSAHRFSKKPRDEAIVNKPVQKSQDPLRQLYADPAVAASQARDKIAAARVWLLKEKPFFGVLARALSVTPSLQVAAFRLTPDDRLLVNPLVVLELKFPSLVARVAHVALHAALGAHVRRAGREPLRWNVAHDLAIEPLLRAASLSSGVVHVSVGLELPPGASAEHYHAALPEDARPGDLWCDISDPPPKTTAPPAGTFTRQDDGEGDDPGESAPNRPGDKPSGKGNEGGNPAEEIPEDPSDRGAPIPSPLEARSRELQWKMRLGAALEEEIASGGKTFGTLPGWIDEMVRATIEPPQDWSATLQRSVAMLARFERSFLRPSRRMSALVGSDGEWPDVVSMPGRRVHPAGRLAAVIDTSASIDTRVLARFLGALASVAASEGFDEIRVLQADAEVTRDETITTAELMFYEVAIVGRGGTDFGPALRRLRAESLREGERFTVVYLTDLDGLFPPDDEVSPLEVLWVLPGPSDRAAPFGRIAKMSEGAP